MRTIVHCPRRKIALSPRWGLGLILSLAPSSSSLAAIRVPEDYPSIALGLQHAFAGDSVIVECGTYPESGLVLRPGVILTSEAGDPSCVTIEGGYQGSILTCADGVESARLEGVTLVHGGWLLELFAYGGGLNAQDCAVTISNCRFESNFGGQKGGAIYAEGATIEIENSVFHANRGTGSGDGGGQGGAIACYLSSVRIEDCLFLENHSDMNIGGPGGALSASSSSIDIVGSEFVENWTYGSAGAIDLSSGCMALIRTTVFRENRAGPGFYGSGIVAGLAGSLDIEACLFVKAPTNLSVTCEILVGLDTALSVTQSTFVALGMPSNSAFLRGGLSPLISKSLFIVSDGVRAYACESADPSFECCDIYSPTGNAWADCYADQLGVNGNISVDPQFCGEAGSGNYYLQSDSPCAPANNSCGELIGALPVGCEAVATKASSISAIKSLY